MSHALTRIALSTAVVICATHTVHAELTLVTQFNPNNMLEIDSIAFDYISDTVWVYGENASDLRQYSTSGVFLQAIPRPGEQSNDADLDIASEELVINETLVPAGTLLFTNGETDTAEIYAIDPDTGDVLATLNTAFGVDHVVGGAYHSERNTFFLVQDRGPSLEADENIIAEIDPVDGSVLNSFKIDHLLPDFFVRYGDIDISPVLGGLYVVSDSQTSIAHFSPGGSFIRTLDLPVGVSGLSGIGLADDESGSAWVTSQSGVISLLNGFPMTVLLGDLNGDGFVGIDDLNIILNHWNLPVTPFELLSGDPSGDGFVGIDDLNTVLGNWNAGTPPTASGATVPEPGTLALLGLGVVTLGSRRRVAGKA